MEKTILPQASQKNGALYIGKFDVVSLENCLTLCCENVVCTVGVYTSQKRNECFLFNCLVPNVCNFTSNPHYTTFIHRSKTNRASSTELLPTFRRGSLRGQCSPNEPCRVEHSLCDSGSCICQSGWIEKKRVCVRSVCKNPDIQFQCDDGSACVPSYNVCNGISDCRDESDERLCDRPSISDEHQKFDNETSNDSLKFFSSSTHPDDGLSPKSLQPMHRTNRKADHFEPTAKDALPTEEFVSRDDKINFPRHGGYFRFLRKYRPDNYDSFDSPSLWSLRPRHVYPESSDREDTNDNEDETSSRLVSNFRKAKSIADSPQSDDADVDGDDYFPLPASSKYSRIGHPRHRYLSQLHNFLDTDRYPEVSLISSGKDMSPLRSDLPRDRGIFSDEERASSHYIPKQYGRKRIVHRPVDSSDSEDDSPPFSENMKAAAKSIVYADPEPKKGMMISKGPAEGNTMFSQPVALHNQIEWQTAMILLAIGLIILSCLCGLAIGRCRQRNFAKTGPYSKEVAANRLRRRLQNSRQLECSNIEKENLLTGLHL